MAGSSVAGGVLPAVQEGVVLVHRHRRRRAAAPERPRAHKRLPHVGSWYYHIRVAIEFTESAGKHGFTVEDAIWAMQHARLVKPEFDDSRVPGRARPTLYIGPSRNPRHPLLEVMVEILPPSTVVIFHLMPARQKHLDLNDRRRT